MNKMRRDALDLVRQACIVHHGRKLDGKMHMIRHSANGKHLAFQASRFAFDTAIHITLDIGRDEWNALVGGPNEMQIDSRLALALRLFHDDYPTKRIAFPFTARL